MRMQRPRRLLLLLLGCGLVSGCAFLIGAGAGAGAGYVVRDQGYQLRPPLQREYPTTATAPGGAATSPP